VLPILLTLMAASGGSVSVGIFRPAVAFLCGVVLKIFSEVIFPLAIVTALISFVSGLSSEIHIRKLGTFFKSLSGWLIGLVLGLFSLCLSLQGFSAAQYDGISLKMVKYVISGSVPMVGGFLSGSVDFILAGSAFIKNALGSFSMLLLVEALLKPLLLLAALQLFLRIAAAASEPLGGRVSALFSDLAGDMKYFLACILSIAFLYFLTLILLVCSSAVIV